MPTNRPAKSHYRMPQVVNNYLQIHEIPKMQYSLFSQDALIIKKHTCYNRMIKITLAFSRFPNLKLRAATLLRISGGTSASTFSFRILAAVPYAFNAA